MEHRQVVENPERAALSGYDQILIALLNREVCDGDVRQVELERLPALAVAEGDVHAEFRSGVEQSAARGVFAYDARESAVGDSGVNLLPGLAVVVRLV